MRMVPTLKHIIGRVGQIIWPAATVCLVLLADTAAWAQTACVRCSGPEQVYRCDVSSDGAVTDQAVGFFCLVEDRERTYAWTLRDPARRAGLRGADRKLRV